MSHRKLLIEFYSSCAVPIDNLLKRLFFPNYQLNMFSFLESIVLVKWLKKKTVSTGPFRGMKYPELKSYGSTLFPKLCGNYEQCLHPILHFLKDKYYEQIVNIGCAEGYYTVGLALLFKNIKVYGFDPDKKAIEFAKKMSVINQVQDRVILKSLKFTSSDIEYFNPLIQSLWIVDCEGDELNMFSLENIEYLANTDLIIELHDYINPQISNYIRTVFKNTHDITLLSQRFELPDTISFLPNIKRKTLLKLIDEKRPVKMEWMFLNSKKFPLDSLSISILTG